MPQTCGASSDYLPHNNHFTIRQEDIFRETMPTAMNDLPDELLLQIGAHFTHLDRNSDLARLALVSQRWRHVAQEWLMKAPRFNVMYIDEYLWELAHHEHLQPQIRSVEIWSSSKDRHRPLRDASGRNLRTYRPIEAPTGWDPLFTRRCDEIINHFALDKNTKKEWVAALQEDCVPALFGVLISVLPNLKELRLGNTWLMDFPIFCCLNAGDALSFMLPLNLHHGFLNSPLQQMLSRLEILDVSADITGTFFFSRTTTTVFSFAHFTNLKEIGITMKALWWQPSRRRPASDPREIFPATLEVLKISEATYCTPEFVRNVRTAKSGGHFPVLRRVEVYFMESREAIRKQRSSDPVTKLRRACKRADISVYIYFPAYELRTWEIGCTPWRLREDRQAFQLAKLKDVGRLVAANVPVTNSEDFEVEFEVDGDAVMQE